MAAQQPAPATGAAAQPNLRDGWKVLVVVVIGVMMVVLDGTVINVALAALQQQYNAGPSAVQWVISLYALALGVATPIAGYLGERFGAKRTYLGALAGFAVASLACGLAPTLPLLIAARGLQGFAGGLALPIGAAMLFTAFPPDKRGLAYGVFGLAVIAAPAIGPLLGGALVDAGQLPWVFYLNVPIGALALVLGNRFLREERRAAAPRADLAGMALAMIGLGALLFGVSLAGEGEGGWSDPTVLLSCLVGLLALGALVVVELRTPEPLLDLRLFQVPSFAIAGICSAVGAFALFGAAFLLPLYLQQLRGLSGLESGLMLLPLAVMAGIASIVGGRLADRFGPRLPILIGFVLLTINTFLLARLDLNSSLVWVAVLLGVRGISTGLIIQNTQLAALARLPIQKVGRATPIVQALSQVAQAFGVALLAALLAGSITEATAGAADFQEQYLAGLSNAYLITTGVVLAATLLAVFLPAKPAPADQAAEQAAVLNIP